MPLGDYVVNRLTKKNFVNLSRKIAEEKPIRPSNSTKLGRAFRHLANQVRQNTKHREIAWVDYGTSRRPHILAVLWTVPPDCPPCWMGVETWSITTDSITSSLWLMVSAHATSQLIRRINIRNEDTPRKELGAAIATWALRSKQEDLNTTIGDDFGEAWIRTTRGAGVIQPTNRAMCRYHCDFVMPTWVSREEMVNPILIHNWDHFPTGRLISAKVKGGAV